MKRFWAVVPAAGSGRRMGAELPKQYLPLHGRTVIEHTLERLASHPAIAGVVVVLAADDRHFESLGLSLRVPLWRADGGAERCHSVRNALTLLTTRAGDDDWVLVHDAARPCLRHADLDHLLERLEAHPVGGLLGLPVADTMKRTDADGEVVETVSRERLWRALTPQMFRLGMLRAALDDALAAGELVTDDAAAMERLGHRPRMVEGHGDNLKITRPQDLALAELYLQQQETGR